MWESERRSATPPETKPGGRAADAGGRPGWGDSPRRWAPRKEQAPRAPPGGMRPPQALPQPSTRSGEGKAAGQLSKAVEFLFLTPLPAVSKSAVHLKKYRPLPTEIGDSTAKLTGRVLEHNTPPRHRFSETVIGGLDDPGILPGEEYLAGEATQGK